MPNRSPPTKSRRLLARNVRKLREARGWSQEVLSERANLSRVSVSNIETATFAASVDTIDRLAHALGLTPAQLLS